MTIQQEKTIKNTLETKMKVYFISTRDPSFLPWILLFLIVSFSFWPVFFTFFYFFFLISTLFYFILFKNFILFFFYYTFRIFLREICRAKETQVIALLQFEKYELKKRVWWRSVSSGQRRSWRFTTSCPIRCNS